MQTTSKAYDLVNFPKGYKLPNKELSKYQLAKYTKKIKQCSSDEISGLILSLCVVVGVNNPPKDAEKDVLISLLAQSIPEVSVQELKLAFLEAAKKSFEVETKTYGVFSLEYICRIHKKYLEWQHKNHKLVTLIPDETDKIEAKKKAALDYRNRKINAMNELLQECKDFGIDVIDAKPIKEMAQLYDDYIEFFGTKRVYDLGYDPKKLGESENYWQHIGMTEEMFLKHCRKNPDFDGQEANLKAKRKTKRDILKLLIKRRL